ncbi:4'-phosphopantetheinyl transferase family protein [Nitrosovibrio tenuis]|uniref:4'-phosphopantetheinyl transferase n=1 Tax=Nitrosovibrio tenuis TaxID=1233 RepID=A0A1H7R495_9PROT|nr:4'-phosphopantetheinyl transferase superfamily protein [Nitrosovibrio tenuis]SEL55003.1 4'-phosphopantetheinyl transferase [Nitrosovibrio tenuis]
MHEFVNSDITLGLPFELPIELPEGVVHLWYMTVPPTHISLDHCLSILDEEERYRTHRFRFERDRVRFVLGRASLRCLLAQYTGSDPALIRFKQNHYGKPFLQYPPSSVQFNVTHSGDCIVHAITHGTEVGVDVEVIRDSVGLASISSYFTAGEQGWLHAADPEERNTVFFTFWICKEAYIKALGRGLSKSLDSFEITLGKRKEGIEGIEGIEPKLFYDSEDGAASASWRLVLFEPGRDVLGCLAVNGASKIVELREYGRGTALRRIALT